MKKGARWAGAEGDPQYAAKLQEKARSLSDLLEQFWSDAHGVIRSRLPQEGAGSGKDLDFAVILGVLHAGLKSGPHRVEDARVRATFQKLEKLFAKDTS